MLSELDKVLTKEELELARENEITRILECHAEDFFSILEINPLEIDVNALQNETKKKFRRTSLLIHPDKTSNPRAPLAFDRLKKSEQVLSTPYPLSKAEEDQLDTNAKTLASDKSRLLDIYHAARKQIEDTSTSLEHRDTEGILLRNKVSQILTNEQRGAEIERNFQQRQLAQQRAESKKLEEEKKILKKLETQWEDDRDKRVSNWRKYANKVEKKRPKKKNSKKDKLLV
ncbi:uncharacterized protein PRCAT00003215001 [Priceomyces carsonii]|uniref:uncharacterized protein n=1 Tax=Priceomyces carsonii TaxID=28549 RepID=UPI002ED81ADD|nr:unnamed protein product [Priceomyces carsonii]